MEECSDDLAKNFAATESGKRLRGTTVEEKAQNLQKGFGVLKTIKSQNACEHMPAWGNLKQKDPRWLVRFHKCKPDAPCAEWGKCVGDALGQPLK